LHRSKYLAVSAGLNRVVSVRNSVLLQKGVTLYLSRLNWSVFGLSSQPFPKKELGSYPIPAYTAYHICILFTSMLYSSCECEAILTFIVNNVCVAEPRSRFFLGGVLFYVLVFSRFCLYNYK